MERIEENEGKRGLNMGESIRVEENEGGKRGLNMGGQD